MLLLVNSFVIELYIFLQEQAGPLHTDDDMPLYVLSIQERAKQLASQFEDKPAQPKVTIYHRKLIINVYTLHIFGSLALLVNLTFLRVDTRIIHVFPVGYHSLAGQYTSLGLTSEY